MKKRMLSLLLSLCLVGTLFAGMGATAWADGNTITYTMVQGDTVAMVCAGLGIDFAGARRDHVLAECLLQVRIADSGADGVRIRIAMADGIDRFRITHGGQILLNSQPRQPACAAAVSLTIILTQSLTGIKYTCEVFAYPLR